ncbi:MAG TPA: hypothetical protein DCY42_08610 [Chloroflexi bacterium]|nr:hypothetical protein [Chloroflexota bacterium]
MDIWSEILSRDPSRICKTFLDLNLEEKVTVRAHLMRMTSEDGWHPEQIKSASVALDALHELPDD